MTAPVARMSAAVSKFADSASKQIAKLDDELSKVQNVLSTGVKYAAAGAAATGVAIASVVKTGADFEQAIANVGAVSLMTAKEVGVLRKRALELGASTRYSATEVAEAFENMGRAGFSNEQMLTGIEGVLSAAAAEGAGIGEIAETISKVIKGMRLDQTGDMGKQATRVADVLALASARTNASILSLGESMKTLGPTAAQFNIPLETSVAMVSLLQDAGLDASQAGTNLASALTKLTDPSKETAAMVAQMGISFEDASGNMKSAEKIFAEMTAALSKSKGNYKQAAFFAKLVGIDSQKAVINLEDMFKSGRAKGLIDELNQAAGVTNKMAKLRMDTFSGDVEQLGGAIDTLKIQLFSMQSGPLRGVVQELTKWIEANGQLYATKLGDLISQWAPIVEMFVRGMVAGARELELWARWAADLISPLTSLFGDGNKAKNAADLGKAVVVLGGAFFTARALVKGAELAMWAFELASKAVHGITWLVQGAVKAGQAAWWLYQASTKAGVGATIAMSLASKAATVDLLAQRAAAFAAAGGMAGLAAAAGVAAVGIGAAYMANEQLKKETEGMGLLDIGAEMYKQGTWSPFKVIDRHQNELARERRESGKQETLRGGETFDMKALTDLKNSLAEYDKDLDPAELMKKLESVTAATAAAGVQVVTPQARTAQTIEEKRTTVQSEIVIRDETGRAEVTKKPPPGAPSKLRLNQSGGL